MEAIFDNSRVLYLLSFFPSSYPLATLESNLRSRPKCSKDLAVALDVRFRHGLHYFTVPMTVLCFFYFPEFFQVPKES